MRIYTVYHYDHNDMIKEDGEKRPNYKQKHFSDLDKAFTHIKDCLDNLPTNAKSYNSSVSISHKDIEIEK